MERPCNISETLLQDGFVLIEDVYSPGEIDSILNVISQVDTANPAFRKTNDLFAIRRFLKEVPASHNLIFNDRLKSLAVELFGNDYFIVKSIYFDKPAQSNWFVAYHQDLTISVDKKLELPGFGSWTVKQNQFAVQPPFSILENNFTIRVHLDDTDESNGALKVIPGSHHGGIHRNNAIDRTTETICSVKKGGIMVMKPLLLHASNRTTNHQKRRVIHIEFSNALLPNEINWAEKLEWN